MPRRMNVFGKEFQMPSHDDRHGPKRGLARGGLMVALCSLVVNCASLGSSGPSTADIQRADQASNGLSAQIKIVNLDEAMARRVIASGATRLLSDVLGDGLPFGAVIGKGDVLDVSIWEAPPAALFGSVQADPRAQGSNSTARATGMPEQMVGIDGQVSLPFIGRISVAGRTTSQVERDIAARLKGIAHQPQVLVRVSRNATADVTVVGDVVNSARIPLTPKGERLLDIIATAGGVKQPVGKTTIQVARRGVVAALPLEKIINDPSQNIRLEADDVVTALFQPFSFIALGASGNNAEIPFEGTGITLAQALGRVGGLRDERANPRGVFIFRLEDPAAFDPEVRPTLRTTPAGKVPVIYRVDLKNPGSFFIAQDFPIRNHDIVYVSNAPGADLQKFVSIVSSMAFSIVGIRNSL